MSRFGIIPASVYDDERMDAHLRDMLALLSTYADRDGWCWPSQETLAKQLRLSRTSVTGYVTRLVELGYVRRRRTQNGSQYRLAYDRGERSDVDGVDMGSRPGRHGKSTASTSDVDGIDMHNKDEQTNEQTIEQPKKGARLREDWQPTSENLLWAAQEHPSVDLARETELFRNHWLDSTSPNAIKRGWSRAWQNWIIKAEKDYANVRQFPHRDSAGGRHKQSDAERRERMVSALRDSSD